MISYLDKLDDLIKQIQKDQFEHLENNVKKELFKEVSDSSTFNNPFIDSTRRIKQIIQECKNDVAEVIDHFNK